MRRLGQFLLTTQTLLTTLASAYALWGWHAILSCALIFPYFCGSEWQIRDRSKTLSKLMVMQA
jgi:hypothetical protein